MRLHRFKADESYQVGGLDAPVKNYLNIPAIIQIAKDIGVDYVHPGYGFLSENAEFAQACVDADIKFVGPTPEMLREFGDKTAARKIADAAGVPTVPGTADTVSDWKDVKEEAKRIGFPLIIKARTAAAGVGCGSSKRWASCRRNFRKLRAKPAQLSARVKCSSNGSSSMPSILKSSSWAIRTATSCISLNAIARFSGGIRKLWSWPRRSVCRWMCGRRFAKRRPRSGGR